MNIKLNFKQSWNIIRQNKLFSGIYIAGTAISITMVMVIAIVWLSKTADLYPEVNRSRMMSIKGMVEKGNKLMSSSRISHKFVEEFIRTVPDVECATEVVSIPEISYLSMAGDDARHGVAMTCTDSYFWKVFEFKFLAGAPYSEEEVASKITKAVITEKMADLYFEGVESAVGKHFFIDFVDYTVCGVVKDVSGVMSVSYADIWIPITNSAEYQSGFGKTGYLGNVSAYILARSPSDFEKIKSEVTEKVAAYNNSSEDYKLDAVNQPDSYAKGLIRVYSNEDVDLGSYILKMALVILLLLLVPAINLAGMISSRMSGRVEEMGIRKTFGAPKRAILLQIMNENMLLTLIGGAVGIVLSYIVLFVGGDMIMALIIPNLMEVPVDSFFTLSMLMNPWIFVLAFAVCLILNLLAAIIPAVNSLNNNIVDSLNVKR